MGNVDFPGILTLSGTVPAEPGVGGVILHDLQRDLPAGALQFIPAVSGSVCSDGWSDQPEGVVQYVQRRYEAAWRPVPGVIGEALGWTARKILFERHCRSLVSQICQNPAAQSCDRIWAILDCPTVIQIARPVAEKLRKPLVLMVWDSPQLLAQQFHMDRWSAANMLARFDTTVQAAERVGVICEQMQKAYEQQFGPGHYVVMRHGLNAQLWSPPSMPSDPDRLVIGFAGSITARQPFLQLIRTLDANDWRINSRNVTLRLIGSRYMLDSRRPQHIEYYGWRTQEDTVRLLAECNLLYLPQPFESELRPLAELSFPTKLTTYLAAGRRILLHAPEYASITPFLRDYPVGIQCSSLESESLQTSLQQLLRLPASETADAIHAARRDEFNDSVFVNRFHELVGVPLKNPHADTNSAAKVAERI